MRFLFGKYRYSIDAKGRVAIPPRFREILKNGKSRSVVLLEGFEGCLFCYPPDIFDNLLELLGVQYQDFDSQGVRELLRRLASTGTEVEMDSQGRIQLTEEQREVASLSREALLVGVGRRIEIWAPDQFSRRPNQSSGATLAEGVLSRIDLGLKADGEK